jgi:hypothetical protein
MENASVVLQLVEDMIDKGVVSPGQVTILTFYRAQAKLYRQGLRNLAIAHPNMFAVQVRTVDSMQGNQAPFVLLDVVTTSKLGFMRMRNRVNVACSRAMDGLAIVGDIDGIMKDKPHLRRHFGNVFNHVKKLRAEITYPDPTLSQYLPKSLKREDILDQENTFIEEVKDSEQAKASEEVQVSGKANDSEETKANYQAKGPEIWNGGGRR